MAQLQGYVAGEAEPRTVEMTAGSETRAGAVHVYIAGTAASALSAGKAEDAAHVSGDVGTMALAVRKDTAAALAGSDGDYAPLEVDATGNLWVQVGGISGGTNTVGAVLVRPETTGGLSTYRNIDLDETGVLVKGAAGQVYGWYIYNAGAAARYIRIYNHVDAPAVGDSADILATIALPAGGAANVFSPIGLACSAGIGLRATTGVADNDAGAPGANEIVINLFYK